MPTAPTAPNRAGRVESGPAALSPARPRVVLAVNPTSGRGRGGRAGELAATRLRAAGVDVEVLSGSSAAEAARLIRACVVPAGRPGTGAEEAEPRLDALVVVGGDGMVNLGVTSTAGRGVPLGIVPAGTGNDVARMLSLPLNDPHAAVGNLLACLGERRHRDVDAVRCAWTTSDGPASRWFAGVLAAGFDAVVNERANGWSRPRGRLRYPLALARELPVFRPIEYELELDGVRVDTAAMLITVANSPSYGGGMKVCPGALPDDGLLDVMIVHPLSRVQFVRIFPRVYSGTHINHPAVAIHHARHVRIGAAGIVGYADGERFGPLPMTCEVVPGALRMLAPVPPR